MVQPDLQQATATHASARAPQRRSQASLGLYPGMMPVTSTCPHPGFLHVLSQRTGMAEDCVPSPKQGHVSAQE